MATKVITGFPTEEVAEAFADGMLYVNDSAISEIEVEKANDSSWDVRFEDDDYLDNVTMPYERGNMGA